MSWLITVAADWSPKGLHLLWDALSPLSQPAWLFFPLSFFFFFPLFFLPLLTQSNISHAVSMPAISHASPWAAPSLGTQVAQLLCRWLCSCVVLHLGASGPSGVILSLLLGHYLGITITVRGRSPARRDQIEGGIWD